MAPGAILDAPAEVQEALMAYRDAQVEQLERRLRESEAR